jgi:hypothetical protein
LLDVELAFGVLEFIEQQAHRKGGVQAQEVGVVLLEAIQLFY